MLREKRKEEEEEEGVEGEEEEEKVEVEEETEEDEDEVADRVGEDLGVQSPVDCLIVVVVGVAFVASSELAISTGFDAVWGGSIVAEESGLHALTLSGARFDSSSVITCA